MGYISERKARLEAKLVKVQASLDALYDAQLSMSTGGIQSYEFDSGEGKQRTTYFNLTELTKAIENLEATESHLINELYRTGIVSVRVRRKPY